MQGGLSRLEPREQGQGALVLMEEDREPLYMHGQPAHNAKGSPFGGAGSANGAD